MDLEDLRANTDYAQCGPTDDLIVSFWAVLETFTAEQKAVFIQFVTGTSKVPLEGFAGLQGMRGPQKFSIHKAFDSSLLPSAHTCFNQLDLPNYSSMEELKTKLAIALTFGSEGFYIA